MEKIFLGLFALTLMSTSALYASDGSKKKAKAKTVCTKNCPDTKDCHKNAKCPNRPGCICH